MRHIYLIAPLLTVFLLLGIYFLIKSNTRPIPKYVAPENSLDAWTPEEYYRHLKIKPFGERQVHNLLIRRTFQKRGVYLESLEPALDSAGIEIVNVYHVVLGDDYTPVITSGNDWPYHSRNSKHYMNKALDFRIKYIPIAERKKIIELCKKRLKGRFKVIWERGAAEHLHVEMLD